MSETALPLGGAVFEGIARVAECAPQGMVTLRGDLSAAKVKKVATDAAGVAMPGQNMANCEGERGLLWMSPDELMVLCPFETAAGTAAEMARALDGTHALAVNVSDARALFRVTGAQAREVLAKLCPADLSPAGFAPGMIRRTRLAQVPAAIWMDGDGGIRVMCFRSVARYAFGALSVAAGEGSEVGVF
jgi:sarcosine oxidase subunit gamma